jgi:hypothetical protein
MDSVPWYNLQRNPLPSACRKRRQRLAFAKQGCLSAKLEETLFSPLPSTSLQDGGNHSVMSFVSKAVISAPYPRSVGCSDTCYEKHYSKSRSRPSVSRLDQSSQGPVLVACDAKRSHWSPVVLMAGTLHETWISHWQAPILKAC